MIPIISVRIRCGKPATNNRVELVYRIGSDDTELVNKMTYAEKKLFWAVLGCDDNYSNCRRGIYRDINHGGLWIPEFDAKTESWVSSYYTM